MNICIPFGNLTLVLTESEFQGAKDRGEQFTAVNAQSTEAATNGRILDAKGISEVTGIPQTWFLEQARQKKIPCIRGGKYVRFKEHEVIKALSVKSDKRIL